MKCFSTFWHTILGNWVGCWGTMFTPVPCVASLVDEIEMSCPIWNKFVFALCRQTATRLCKIYNCKTPSPHKIVFLHPVSIYGNARQDVGQEDLKTQTNANWHHEQGLWEHEEKSWRHENSWQNCYKPPPFRSRPKEVTCCSLIPRLHVKADIKQTSSKHQATFKQIHVHDVCSNCLMFAWWLLCRVNGV